MALVAAAITCDAIGSNLEVVRVSGSEAMNRLSSWTVDILLQEPFDLEDCLRKDAVLALIDEVEGTERAIPLIIVGAELLVEQREGLRYALELAPQEALLTLASGYRIFQEKTVPEIVTAVLEEAGISSDRLDWRLQGSYQARRHLVQYGEVGWAFIERLLADEGISYWFDRRDAGPLLVFTDAIDGHDGLEQERTIIFDDSEGLVSTRVIKRLEVYDQIGFDRAYVRDFDVRQPDLIIEGEEGDGGLEYYEFPADIVRAEATPRAKQRLQQLQRFKRYAEGISSCIRLQPGRRLDLVGASDEALNVTYLVVDVVHRYERAGRASGDAEGYNNCITLVPAVGPHRPGLPKKPKVPGLEPAITTGPSGEEIHVNDLGDVTLRFPWDRSGIQDDKSSKFMRCIQFGLGGSMILPRVGWEVPVMYLDGNPDNPIVLGRVYNGETAVPYSLPDGMATTTFQSETYPGDGTTNEIRMGDTAGSQEMFIHASRDQNVTVGGSATEDVGVDATHDVALSYGLTILGDQTRDVGANQTVSVGTSYETVIKGARDETVGGLEHTKVTANRTCTASSSYTELVGALYGMQCNQENIDVKGLYTQTVGGSVGLAAGMGISESVTGARALTVRGTQTMTLRAGYDELVIGIKKIDAGANTMEAGTSLGHNARAGIKLQVGGSAKIEAGGAISFKAPSIKIQAASLDAVDFKLAGGEFKTAKDVNMDGKIKRKGGSELEK
jgi:type VI secretion system secreted protein VgrG